MKRVSDAKSRINHKCIYRILRENDLLLQSHTGKPTRTHDGQVITFQSNLRWCSDTFEFHCWNGERVEVAFSLDFCEQEVQDPRGRLLRFGAIAWCDDTVMDFL